MDMAQKQGESVSRVEFDMAIGPMKEAHFFSHMWAYGRHFRIMSRDLDKKTTMDCGIACVYSDERGVGTEYTGYVEKIIRVFFNPTITSVVIKGKWWNSVIRQRGPNGTLMVDDCRFPRIKVGPFMPDSTVADEPLAFPKDCDQVFYVDDVKNLGWKLYVKVNPRCNKTSYLRELEEGETSEPIDNTSNTDAQRMGTSRQGQLVSVVADDRAGEDEDLGEDLLLDEEGAEYESMNEEDDENATFAHGQADIVSDDEESEDNSNGQMYVGHILAELEAAELAELASDGEFEFDQGQYLQEDS